MTLIALSVKNSTFSEKIPTAGLEPAHPKAVDFESTVSTNSTTSALWSSDTDYFFLTEKHKVRRIIRDPFEA